MPVTVAVGPANTSPVTGATTVGTPNTTTGVVTGSVTATDADGDTLTYSGSTTTSKGRVVVAANGSFVYTPTVDARDVAASPSATNADSLDTFVVVTADGYGGTASSSVIVPISPKAAPAVTAGFLSSEMSVNEGNSGTSIVQVPVRLSRPSTETVTVSYQLVELSARAGEDFLAGSGTLVFEPGQTEATVPVTIYGDLTYEAQESLGVRLTGATGATVVLENTEYSRFPFEYVSLINDDPPSASVVEPW